MTNRYTGGVISATAPTVSQAGASGVWNLEEAQYYQKAGTWPVGSGADPYFQNTTLLLHGDGTNGAQNNTFLDGSTNNFTITRNGNATQGSFNPYVGPGNWSAYFNGASGVQWNNGGRIAISSTATFTIEAWVYLPATPGVAAAILADGQNNTATYNWAFQINTDRTVRFYWLSGGAVSCSSTSTVPLNTWTHVAVSVSAGAIKLFINGQLQTLTGTTTLGNPSTTAFMQSGMQGTGPVLYMTGYISNLRLTKSALYSATFTPSTTPLIATTDTTLLAFQNNNFNDLSASNAGATSVFSAPQISKFSPFTFYQTTPASYSGYFDGTGDYLTVSATANAAFGFGTADFTVEAWVYYTGTNASATKPIIDFRGAVATAPSIFGYTSNQLAFFYNGSIVYQPASLTLISNAWNHVALVRSSNVTKFYLNGTGAATTYTDNNNYPSAACIIGSDFPAGGSSYWSGSLSNVRVVKGTAVYTGNFTPSTTPLTAISGTSLLTCQSTTFIDNSTNAFTITANGNATPERANPFTDTVTGPTVYFGTTYGGSAYFDGTGDYLTAPASNSTIWPGSGSFTIEYWLYLPANPSTGYYTHFSYGTSGSVLRVFNTAATSRIEVFSGASVILNPAWPTAGQWNHFALVRNGTTLTLYINGAVAQSVTNSTNFSTGTLTVGGESASNPLLGYISNFRIVKGTAVYTGPFVPPAAPVTAVTNTQLLLNGTNAGIFDNTAFADLETVGNTQISTSVVKYGTGSIYFDGAGDWLIVNSPNGANDYAFGSGDFTLEMWIYPTDITSVMLYDSRPNSSVGVYPTLYINSSSFITYYTNGSDRISGASAVINTWQHIALVRASGATKLYINGTQSGSTYTDANTYLNGASRPIIGVDGGNTSLQNYAGYIDDLRITKGVARYTANFTPPTAAFPNF